MGGPGTGGARAQASTDLPSALPAAAAPPPPPLPLLPRGPPAPVPVLDPAPTPAEVGATIAQADTRAPDPGPGLAPGRAPGGIPGLTAVAGGTQVEAPETDTATPTHHPDVVGMGPAAGAGTWGLGCMGVRDLLGGLGPEVNATRKPGSVGR